MGPKWYCPENNCLLSILHELNFECLIFVHFAIVESKAANSDETIMLYGSWELVGRTFAPDDPLVASASQ
jgi:hypothetical protein